MTTTHSATVAQTDIDKLEALARAAKGWQWETVQGDQFGHFEDGVFYDIGTIDADQYAVGEECHNETVLNFCAAANPATVLALIERDRARATTGVSPDLKTVIAFLLGEGPLDGMHFGDSDTARPRRRYWWRTHLRAAFAQQAGAAASCGLCGSQTTEACNDFGCGFLEAGNGEPSATSTPVTSIDTPEFLILLRDYRYCRESEAGFARSLIKAHIDAQLERANTEGWQECDAELIDQLARQRQDEGERADEAKRLRRVVNLLDMQREVPDSDETLRGALFAVLGQIARKLEFARQRQGEPVAWLVTLPDGELELSYSYTDKAEADDYIENRAIKGCYLTPLCVPIAQQAGAQEGGDSTRLDWLEQMANAPGGLLLHDGGDFTGRLGLGLRRVGRSLRQAIDQARKHDPALAAAHQDSAQEGEGGGA
jgi:hypothetical protein